MELYNLRVTETDSHLELACDALSETARDGPFSMWYQFPPDCKEVGLVAEPFLVALLIPCMRQKENLIVHAPISARLLESLETAMDILSSWNPDLSPISIEADETHVPERTGEEVGCFFSGGVDSFYCLLKNLERHPHDRDSVTHLIILKGYDIGLNDEDDSLWTQALSNAERVAHELGKSIIPIVSNVRVHTDQYTSWGRYPSGDLWGPNLHGSILASFGLCLNRSFRRIIMAAGYSYRELRPWGMHPLLDPLWSTETLEFFHDGAECRRFEKITRQVAKSPVALQILRVCWENPDGSYNCGECEKCLRTMMALEITGALEQCTTFARPFSLERFQRMILSEHVRSLYEELIPGAVQAGREDLVNVLKRSLRNRKTIPMRIKRELERFKRRIAGGSESKTRI